MDEQTLLNTIRRIQCEDYCALGFYKYSVQHTEAGDGRVAYKDVRRVHSLTPAACCHPPPLVSLALVAAVRTLYGRTHLAEESMADNNPTALSWRQTDESDESRLYDMIKNIPDPGLALVLHVLLRMFVCSPRMFKSEFITGANPRNSRRAQAAVVLACAYLNLPGLLEKCICHCIADCCWGRGSSASQGTTALHEAVFSGSRACIRLLLEHGASPSLQDSQGLTPLSYVTVTTSDPALAQLLVEHGANPNEANWYIQNARARSVVGWW